MCLPLFINNVNTYDFSTIYALYILQGLVLIEALTAKEREIEKLQACVPH